MPDLDSMHAKKDLPLGLENAGFWNSSEKQKTWQHMHVICLDKYIFVVHCFLKIILESLEII